MSPRKVILALALASYLLSLVDSAHAQEDVLTVERAVALALARDAELASLRSEVDASKARVSGASLPFQQNPQLGGEIGPRWRDGGMLLDYSVELSQEVEIFGQRRARIEVARAGRRLAEAQVDAWRAELAAKVRQAFARALAAEQLLALERENLEVARWTNRASAKRLEVGEGTRIELNTARVEEGRAARAVSVATRAREDAIAALRLLLALEPDRVVRLDGDLRTASAAVPGTGALEERALATRADLRAAKRAADAARAEKLFAERDLRPRPRVGVRGEREEGDNVLLGTLQLDLPTFNRNQAARGVASAGLVQAEVSLQATERRVKQEVALASLRLQAAQASAQSFEGEVVTAMQENLSLINTAYEAGKIDLFELLLVRRDTLQAKREHIEALEEVRAAEAELARALGLDRGAL